MEPQDFLQEVKKLIVKCDKEGKRPNYADYVDVTLDIPQTMRCIAIFPIEWKVAMDGGTIPAHAKRKENNLWYGVETPSGKIHELYFHPDVKKPKFLIEIF